MQEETVKSILEQFSFGRLFLSILFLALTWGISRLLQIGATLLAQKFVRYRILISSIFPLIRLALWTGSIALVIFVVINPPMNTLIALSASAGLAIGLGAQDLIKNLIAGIMILFDRPFRVGDMVSIAGHYGEVRSIGLRSTSLQTFDDSTVVLPNSLVLEQAVSNSNAGALDEMVVVDYHLPVTSDAGEARRLARAAAIASPYTYLRKPVSVALENAFDQRLYLRLKIKFYVIDIRLERVAASDVCERMHDLVREAGMIPDTTEGVAA